MLESEKKQAIPQVRESNCFGQFLWLQW